MKKLASILLSLLLLSYPFDAFAGTVEWTNDRGGSGSATGTASWTASSVPLKAGVNNITITADDGSGNVGSDHVTITYIPTFPGNTAEALYSFEETIGTNVIDRSGNSNTGTLTNGATQNATGRYGQGLALNGVNQYVRVPDANSLDVTQSFTITAWVQPTNPHSDFRSIVTKNADGDNTSEGPVLRLFSSIQGFCGDGGVAAFVRTNGSLGPDFSVCDPTPLVVGVMTHLAVTYDSAAGLLKLYRNGVLAASTTASGIMAPTTGTFMIGNSQYGEFFDGILDEIRYYNYALPLTGASNTTPSVTCTATNQSDQNAIATASIIGAMNCPIATLTTPVVVSFGATSTVSFGATNNAVKFGATP